MREGYSSILIVPNFNEALTAGFYRRLIPLRRNILLLDYTMAGSYFNYVIQSYDLGVKRAVDYLLERSKGNLVLVKNNIWKGRNLLAELMESTFTGYISGHNVDNCAFILEEHGDLSLEFICRENITGIMCCQDTDALKIYSRIGRAGLNVPRELKLVNYGKTELLELVENKISYIDCKYEKMMKKVCDIILNKQYKSQLEQHVIFPELVIRDT